LFFQEFLNGMIYISHMSNVFDAYVRSYHNIVPSCHFKNEHNLMWLVLSILWWSKKDPHSTLQCLNIYIYIYKLSKIAWHWWLSN
jgi:hypothetical protein